MRFLLLVFFFIIHTTQTHALPPSEEKGVIGLMYHRFEENRYPTTNVRIREFMKQLDAIKKKNLEFINMDQLMDIMEYRLPMDRKRVLLTIDDAYASFYKNAWPILKKEQIPFTLFLNTKEIDQKNRNYMSWEQIRELKASGLATIGHHSYSHDYIVNWDKEEIRKDLLRANADFQRELGYVPVYFSYPFGEYSLEYKELIKELGFKVAFGQHSGVIDTLKDWFELPRFPINENWGKAERFEMVLNTLPMPYLEFLPADKKVSEFKNPPQLEIDFVPGLKNLKNIVCTTNDGDSWPTVPLRFTEQDRVIMEPLNPYRVRTARINCSFADSQKNYRWLGIQFVLPHIPADK
jgi:peptidoglycan/xylan/chitin deacetylase (PgdA/CDA1 family)